MADQRPDSGASKPKSEAQKTAEAWRASQPYLDSVWQLVGSVVGGGVLGFVLDRWLKTSPWLLLSGLGLGIIAGMVEFIRRVTKLK